MSRNLPSRTSAVLVEWLLIALLIFTPFAFGTVTVWAISIMELVCLAIVVVWLVGFAGSKSPVPFRFPLAVPLLLFTGLAFAQLLPHLLIGSAPSRSDSPLLNVATTNFFSTKTEFVKSLCYLGLYLSVVNTLTSRRQITRILTAIVVVGFGVCFLGLIQKASSADKIFWRVEGVPHRNFMAAYVNENHFAGYMELVIPVTLAFAMRYLFRLKKNRRRSILASDEFYKGLVLSILAVMMVVSLAISESRGGLIAFVSSLFFMGMLLLCRRAHRRKAWIITVLLLLSFLALFYMGLGNLLKVWGTLGHVSDDTSVARRIEITRDTWKAVQDYPVWGSGLGTFGTVFPNYGTLRFRHGPTSRRVRITVPHAENDYIQTLLEMGWAGMFTCLLGLVLFFRTAIRTYLTRRRLSISLPAMGGATSIFAILVHSFSDFNLRIDANVFLSVTIVAMVVNLARLERGSPHHQVQEERSA